MVTCPNFEIIVFLVFKPSNLNVLKLLQMKQRQPFLETHQWPLSVLPTLSVFMVLNLQDITGYQNNAYTSYNTYAHLETHPTCHNDSRLNVRWNETGREMRRFYG